MTYSIMVANTILCHCFNEKIEINYTKLQCLIYLLYKTYAKRTNLALFNEPFEAYECGPSLPSVCYFFECFGDNTITQFAHSVLGNIQVADLYKIPELWDVWHTFWIRYKDCNTDELSRIVRLPGSAWYNARKNGYKARKDSYSVLKFEDILLDCYSD